MSGMTKDKDGNPIFVKGKEYRPKVWVTPVWAVGSPSKCIESEPYTYGKEDGEEVTIKDGRGTFTNGNDTRSYVATTQFEEA